MVSTAEVLEPLAFSIIGVPAVALVVKDLTTTELPFKRRVPLEVLAPQVTALGVVELSAPAFAKASTPELIVTPSTNVLFPESVTTREEEVDVLPAAMAMLEPIAPEISIAPAPSKVKTRADAAPIPTEIPPEIVSLLLPVVAICEIVPFLFKTMLPEKVELLSVLPPIV